MTIGFGLDLAGYTGGKSALVAIKIRDEIGHATIIEKSPFSKTRKTNDDLEPILKEEIAALRKCLELGCVAVDVPIDLQNLNSPKSAKKIWQLTHRSVDKKLSNKLIDKDGLAPTADRIGYQVARFQRIIADGNFFSAIGEKLFETYPRAVLYSWGIACEGYKGKKGRSRCRKICKDLNIDQHLTDDDLDAVICAVVAVAENKFLFSKKDFNLTDAEMPKGYRIAKKNPLKKITINKRPFESWEKDIGGAS